VPAEIVKEIDELGNNNPDLESGVEKEVERLYEDIDRKRTWDMHGDMKGDNYLAVKPVYTSTWWQIVSDRCLPQDRQEEKQTRKMRCQVSSTRFLCPWPVFLCLEAAFAFGDHSRMSFKKRFPLRHYRKRKASLKNLHKNKEVVPTPGLSLFGERVSLCSFGCPGTKCVDKPDLKLRDPPASASRVLGLKERVLSNRIEFSQCESEEPGHDFDSGSFWTGAAGSNFGALILAAAKGGICRLSTYRLQCGFSSSCMA
ncbi:hypothetical protein STEG23_021900, partial [Scotinomys teguina]